MCQTTLPSIVPNKNPLRRAGRGLQLFPAPQANIRSQENTLESLPVLKTHILKLRKWCSSVTINYWY